MASLKARILTWRCRRKLDHTQYSPYETAFTVHTEFGVRSHVMHIRQTIST